MRYTPGCEGKLEHIVLALKTGAADKTVTPPYLAIPLQ
jgi:hypothetical protein